MALHFNWWECHRSCPSQGKLCLGRRLIWSSSPQAPPETSPDIDSQEASLWLWDPGSSLSHQSIVCPPSRNWGRGVSSSKGGSQSTNIPDSSKQSSLGPCSSVCPFADSTLFSPGTISFSYPDSLSLCRHRQSHLQQNCYQTAVVNTGTITHPINIMPWGANSVAVAEPCCRLLTWIAIFSPEKGNLLSYVWNHLQHLCTVQSPTMSPPKCSPEVQSIADFEQVCLSASNQTCFPPTLFSFIVFFSS